jgi:membrane protein DedA with SNARE-associated domain
MRPAVLNAKRSWQPAAVFAVALCCAAVAMAQPAADPADQGATAEVAPPPPSENDGVVAQFERSRVGRFIERFTYAAIIGVLFLCGMGLPLPEEVPILTSAVLSQSGHLRPWWALGACMFGVMAGDSLMYYLGRRWGGHLLEHRLSRKLLTAERQQQIEVYFARYGARIIFAGRFLPGLRAPLFLSAGTLRVPFWVFFLMDGAAALLSIPLSFWLAYFFTDKLQEFLNLRDKVHYWGIGLVVLGLLAWLVLHRWWERRHAHGPRLNAGETVPARSASGAADEIRSGR